MISKVTKVPASLVAQENFSIKFKTKEYCHGITTKNPITDTKCEYLAGRTATDAISALKV